jgi:two-component system, NtrC family, response regulator AtoC
LIESELFGHEKGAFTGANNRRIGRFEEANGGTLFLDEIGEMDINVQAKLLRVLQEKELSRVGGNAKVSFDVRVITATHTDLQKQVEIGKFRSDLYYRLLGLSIALPPLRDRGDDIQVLAKYFAETAAKENKTSPKSFSTEARSKLQSHHFPGNVRELRAVVELAIIMSNSEVIQAKDIVFQQHKNVDDLLSNEYSLKEFNFRIVQHFLKKYDNNAILVAKKLRVGKSTIYRMLKDEEFITLL